MERSALKVRPRLLLHLPALFRMRLTSSTRSPALLVTSALQALRELKLALVSTPLRDTMALHPPTVTMATRAPLAQLVRTSLPVLPVLFTQLALAPILALPAPLGLTATRLKSSPVSPASSAMSAHRPSSTSSALLVPTRLLVQTTVNALSATVVTLACNVV